jgi:hypothetical protein
MQRSFTGRYAHRQIQGEVGHNLPREAPAAFVAAVIDVAKGYEDAASERVTMPLGLVERLRHLFQALPQPSMS